MILSPVSTPSKLERRRTLLKRTVTPGPLTDIELRALDGVLERREHVRGALRGADADDVYLWVVTERRLLQLVHAIEGVFLLRLMPLAQLRALHLQSDGERATLCITSRKRTYRLEGLQREEALRFAHQLGVPDVLITTHTPDAGR
jgi:hypothetical protein